MNEDAYEELLKLVTPRMQREDSVMRRSISLHERLSCTLRWLATGRTYRDMKYSVGISEQALSLFIPETCEAIFAVLREQYMKVSENI